MYRYKVIAGRHRRRVWKKDRMVTVIYAPGDIWEVEHPSEIDDRTMARLEPLVEETVTEKEDIADGVKLRQSDAIGWYDVVSISTGEPVNPKKLRIDDAQDLVDELTIEGAGDDAGRQEDDSDRGEEEEEGREEKDREGGEKEEIKFTRGPSAKTNEED